MIGGSDQVFGNAGLRASDVLDAVVRRLRARWPRAIVQDAETAERYAAFPDIPFGQVRELFVYRDDAAFKSWEEFGADSSNANSMVHLIADENELTIVVDDPGDPTMRSLLAEARQLLEIGVGWDADFPCVSRAA